MEFVASLSQGRTAAAQCGLFTHKSVPVIFEPPCTIDRIYEINVAFFLNVLGDSLLQNGWLRALRYHFIDRCARTHGTSQHSIEGIPSLSIISNSHSVKNMNHSQNKISKWKQHSQNNSCLSHLCPGNLY